MMYTLCAHPGCFHFVEPNDAYGDSPGLAEYVHLDDGEKEHDHDATPLWSSQKPLSVWRSNMPELFREYPDGKIGPNSACFADAHALDAIARWLNRGDQWPSGADFVAGVAERLRATGRNC